MIRILGNTATSGAYLLEQPAWEVADLPGATQRQWQGRGAELLGLVGPVEPAHLGAVLEGQPLGTGVRPDPRRVRSAFDLVIGAPKGVSILFASPDADVAAQVVAAHQRSVEEALVYLEQRAASVRREHNGERTELGIDGLIAAGFTHGVSRSGDPHLHTHLLVANLAHGLDGRFTSLDTGGLRFHARAADALYRAHLRSELGDRLDVAFERCRDGALEIQGISDATLLAFSGRSRDVAQGHRFSNEPRWTPRRTEAVALWQDRAGRIIPFEGRQRERTGSHLDEHRLAGALHGTSPRAREGLAAICDAAGAGMTAQTAVSFLTRLPGDLGRGANEFRLAERSFVARPAHLRVLGPRPARLAALERWRQDADQLDRRLDRYRDRLEASLERSERHGSSR